MLAFVSAFTLGLGLGGLVVLDCETHCEGCQVDCLEACDEQWIGAEARRRCHARCVTTCRDCANVCEQWLEPAPTRLHRPGRQRADRPRPRPRFRRSHWPRRPHR